MGSVADKIAKKIVSSRKSKVVDLAGWREGRKMALEAGFGGDGLPLGKFVGLDPCQALYFVGQNVVSLMSESICMMREANGYVRIAGDAEDRYLPTGPPMSPLTVSYFLDVGAVRRPVRQQPGNHGQLRSSHRSRIRLPELAGGHR